MEFYMPERFNFACVLFEPHLPSPESAISSVAAAFPDRIGSPVEVVVHDVGSKYTESQRWPTGQVLLGRPLGPTELLFVYYLSLRTTSGRVCISYKRGMFMITLTVSLEDMAIADEGVEVSEACLQLRNFGLGFATDCIVAAGGEIEFNGAPQTPAEALATMIAPFSLAQWIACEAAPPPEGHFGFEVVRQTGRTCVLSRNNRTYR
jgi:hypothetical protein